MKLKNQLGISPLREGWNALKTLPSYKLGKSWTRPVSVNLLLTSRCNSKCVTCDSWKLTDHDGELRLDEYQKLAIEMAEMKIPIVTVGGGEPTLRQDLWEIISAFKGEGINVQVTTNALTLREGQRKRFYESKTDRMTISVDSHRKDTYEVIRGVDGAENILENLQALLEEKPSWLEVDTNTVLCAENADTFLDTIDYLIEMGVPKVNFSAVTTSDTNYLMTDSKESLAQIPMDKVQFIVYELLRRKKATGAIAASSSFIRGMADYHRDPTKLVFPCYAGYLTIDIFQDGSLHGCGNLPSFGNIRDGSLAEVWSTLKAEENRRKMVEGECTNCYLSCKIELAIGADPRRLPRFALEKLL